MKEIIRVEREVGGGGWERSFQLQLCVDVKKLKLKAIKTVLDLISN